MKVIHGAANYDQGAGRPVLALGNFDGLHMAHRFIVERARESAREKELKSTVFLLDPHPLKVLYPQKEFVLLTTLKERAEILSSLGLDYLLVEPFTAEMAALPPFHFFREYLVKTLGAVKVVVGYDYTFGRRGKGTTAHLLKWGAAYGLEVEVVPPVMLNNHVVSSSLIRELLAKGEVEKAVSFLGSYFRRSGMVVHGEGRGRRLGFPTANLDIAPGLLLPASGVYLTMVRHHGEHFFGLTSIGSKPTFSTSRETIVEVFLLDYYGNLYAEELTVSFLHRLRGEIAFQGADLLKKQIERDIGTARKLLNSKYSHLFQLNQGLESSAHMFTNIK